MNNPTSPAVDWGDDSTGEMDSEDAAPSSPACVGVGFAISSMMEVDAADARHPPSSAPDADDFFNAFPDDFDDQDLD